MVVERGVARVRRGDPLAEQVAAGLVGVPERVVAVGEVDARLAGRGAQAVLLERPQERHLDVDVVLVELVDRLGLPLGHLVGRERSRPGSGTRSARRRPTPAIWPIQPAFILSRYSARGTGAGRGLGFAALA